MESNKEQEAPRFEGANWDNPVVKVKRSNKAHASLARKVLTRGVERLYMGGMFKGVKEKLRAGKEVRLCDELGNDAIRIYPIASTDCKRMNVRTQAMGVFTKCLADKKLRIRHGDHELNRDEARELMSEQQERHDKAKAAAFEAVTPDTIVQCPKCGYQFRVGRPNKE